MFDSFALLTSALPLLVLVVFVGFLISLIIPERNERALSGLALWASGLHLALSFAFVLLWLLNGGHTINVVEIDVYRTEGYDFFIDFLFDKVTAVFLLVGALLTFLITRFSRYYLHREEGYKRFFNTVLFFFLGYNVTILSGNFETLFLGWEILGASSFLLIAFYRERYLPVKNGFKVFSIYRIGDIGMLLAMWMSHHLWQENITFFKLENNDLMHDLLFDHSWIGLFISLSILLSSSVKSAQLPFSAWLPRAMEGPTPSSAIFYSSLSVHIGVFLLLRTFPLWENQWVARVTIVLLGLATSIIAAPMARVQASIKAQVAYSSIAQIGIMFIEVALGLDWLALIHFTGNAFLRTYQLLISPSTVTYLIREQFYHFTPPTRSIEDSLPRKIENTLYILSLKEWNLDTLLYRVLWKPIKELGSMVRFVNVHRLFRIILPLYSLGVVLMYFNAHVPSMVIRFLPEICSLIGLSMALHAFNERHGVRLSWILITLSHFWVALSVSFNEHFGFDHIVLYLSGVLFSSIVGYLALNRIKNLEKHVNLTQFHGHIYEHPRIALVFLIAALGLAGFPITPTFIGEDIIFSHIHETQFLLVFAVASVFLINGLAVIRIYTRVFLGTHIKNYHERADRSA